jgi:hypothetical protein
MILYRINDFKTSPSWIEYTSLYVISSLFVVIFCYAVMGQLDMTYALLSTLLFAMTIYIFATIRRVRQQRALLFYCECLAQFSPPQLQALLSRYRKTDQEYAIVCQRLDTLKMTLQDKVSVETVPSPELSVG